MGHNAGLGGRRGYKTTPRLKMAAFDRLPADLREVLANAKFDWAVQPVLTDWRLTRDAPGIKRMIQRADLRMTERTLQRRESG